MRADAPSFPSLWPEIRSRLGQSVVVGHNPATERKFLRRFPGHGFGPVSYTHLRLALEGRIAGGKDGILLAEDGNQNVLVGQMVTRSWPAATGDASVDKQRFERVEWPFTLEFQGDRVLSLIHI